MAFEIEVAALDNTTSQSQNPVVVELGLDQTKLDEVETALEDLSATGQINGPARATSFFYIGDPIVTQLSPNSSEVDANIRPQLDQYDFFHVVVPCSFEPSEGTRYHSATFEIKLETTTPSPSQPTVSTATATAPDTAAIIYQVFPTKLEDERKISKRIGFDPQLKMELPMLGTVNLAGGLPGKGTSDYLVYNTRVEAIQPDASTVRWNFSRTDQHEISGLQPLLLVIRKPKTAKILAKFSLKVSAELLFKFGPIGPLPYSTNFLVNGQAVSQPTLPLC